jgi:hypothetical protein
MSVAAEDPEAWAVGFCDDECWWSRLALPTLSSWSEEGKPLRLVQRSVAEDDPSEATKAVCCYGLYLPHIGDPWLRFVAGRPVSSITTQFLEWSLEKLEGIGKKVLLLIWDNASWHVSKELRRWLGKAQPLCQRERLWSEDRKLSSAQTESVAERHRAQVGSRQAQGCRA